MNKDLLEFLLGFVSDHKKALFDKIIEDRTSYFSVVLENVYQAQNASAVLRTCDCLGIQNVHIIENDNQYQLNPTVTLGSNKWLTIENHNQNENNTKSCLEGLKKEGYKIVSTSPHTGSISLEELPLDKYAFVFGSEKEGISQEVLDLSDICIRIPMYGFTESYNISVSAAITLSQMIFKLKDSEIDWDLGPDERNSILINWAKSAVKKPDLLVKEFNSRLV